MSQKIFNNNREITRSTLIVGVDIGMTKHYGYWETCDGACCKTFEFGNDYEGFSKLWNKIEDAKKRLELKKVVLGFESTGSYGEPLLYFLLNKNVRLVQVNPTHTKKFREVIDNNPLKSDRKDPKVIAALIAHGHFINVSLATDNAARLRRLTNSRERFIKDRSSYYNRLKQQINSEFPEFFKVFKDIKCKTAFYLLKYYTTPENISKLNKNILGKELSKISRGNFNIKQADKIIDYAMNSMGVKAGLDELAWEVKLLMTMIESLNEFISETEQKMEKIIKRVPESANMLSNKGIGIITAAGILGEVGSFKKYKSQAAILKFAGLNLYEMSSGKHHGIRRITKRGRGLLRKLLYFAAINTIKKDGIMHDYYKRLVETNGMVKKKALIAVSRKLLCLMYAQVRDNTFYMENYHEIMNLKKAA